MPDPRPRPLLSHPLSVLGRGRPLLGFGLLGRGILGLGLLGGALGCGPTDCAALGPGPDRDACYLERAPALFRADFEAAAAAVDRDVGDPLSRDLIYLVVSRDVDPSNAATCARIVDPQLGERCRAYVSRPHLHPREAPPRGAPLQKPGG